ncbi:MAG TPA: hypothetical protein GX706_02485 [Candidatus Moranbacteria bacterium]|nr:hypothetical protein [Candidatus Moranbacteria bacterium]
MSEKFTSTKKVNYGSRLKNSIGGIIFGPLMVIVAAGLLYWNEGRVDLSNIAKQSTVVDADALNTDANLNGKLVSVTGEIKTGEAIGDDLFLKSGGWLAVKRKVEMYAWDEEVEEDSKKNLGGSETVETTYRYVKQWQEDPASSNDFEQSEGHINPEKSLASIDKYATKATVGVYQFNPQEIAIGGFTQLVLDEEKVNLQADSFLANNFIFIKKGNSGTLENPEVGDLRVSYEVINSDFEGTVFGALKNDKIESYFDKKSNKLYYLFAGSREQGIAALHSGHMTTIWIFRLVGFVLMWVGLKSFLSVFSVLLDVVPLLGSLSRSLIGVVTFVIAIALSLLMIIVSKIVHNVLFLILFLVFIAGLVFWLTRKKKKKD